MALCRRALGHEDFQPGTIRIGRRGHTRRVRDAIEFEMELRVPPAFGPDGRVDDGHGQPGVIATSRPQPIDEAIVEGRLAFDDRVEACAFMPRDRQKRDADPVEWKHPDAAARRFHVPVHRVQNAVHDLQRLERLGFSTGHTLRRPDPARVRCEIRVAGPCPGCP